VRRESGTVEVPATRIEAVIEVRCDGCGGVMSQGEPGELLANELVIMLNQSQCVSFTRFRDYCGDCLEPVWLAVNDLIKADPSVERDREHDLYN
jgi:hypothetical protein